MIDLMPDSSWMLPPRLSELLQIAVACGVHCCDDALQSFVRAVLDANVYMCVLQRDAMVRHA